MAKKFGKVLLFTASVGAIATAYFLARRQNEILSSDDYDDDFDDFSEDKCEAKGKRNYVKLSNDFTPLAEQIKNNNEQTVEETVEEFFDEDDSEELDLD